MAEKTFAPEDTLRIASAMAAETVDLLPDGMKEAVSTAFQAVMLSHGGMYEKSQEKIRRLRNISYSREPYCDILSAKNEYEMAERLTASDPDQARHFSRARAALSSYLSSDISKRSEEEVLEARLMKARADYILGHRKGVFMGIVELPEGAEAGSDSLSSIKVRGLHAAVHHENGVIFTRGEGSIFAASLEEPEMMVVAAVSLGDDIMETAERFIRLTAAVMETFAASSFYINGVMLSHDDVNEAITDMAEDAFPVWFFARGSEGMEDDRIVLSAEGAESFGAKAIRIVGVAPEDREEASSALSLILVYHVYSASARRSRTFTINGRTYTLASSDRVSVSYTMA